jgi:Flp pilus assembly protein TadG
MSQHSMTSRASGASLPGSEDGVAIIEFAFVLPVLLLIFVAIFEFGFTFREFLLVTNAAREGARMAVLPGYSDDDVKARVKSFLTAAGGLSEAVIQPVEVTTAPETGPDGSTYAVKTVTARVNHSFSMIAPFATSYGTVPLTGIAVMRVEVAAQTGP